MFCCIVRVLGSARAAENPKDAEEPAVKEAGRAAMLVARPVVKSSLTR